jgi:hypothetical protein
MGRSLLNPYRSLLLMILSHVLSMQERRTFLMLMDGNILFIVLDVKNFLRLVKQAKLRLYQHSPKYKFGYCIPKDYDEALRFDKLNCNEKWKEPTAIEMAKLIEYEYFIQAGIYGHDPPPAGYKKI